MNPDIVKLPSVSEVAASQAGVFALVVPEIVLIAAACVLFILATVRGVGRERAGIAALLALFGAGVALWITAAKFPSIEARQENIQERTATLKTLASSDGKAIEKKALDEGQRSVELSLYTNSILQSRIGLLTRLIAIVGGIVLVLFSWHQVSHYRAAEYHACLLVIVAGLGLTGASNDLITLFVALELISIPTYVILYLQRTDRQAQEAAAKYFLLSVFSSGLLLFGFSYMYGVTGSTNLPAMLDGLHSRPTQVLTLVAVVMVVAGLGFKITAVPFHFYAPDVYQGAAPAAAALLAFVPKVAGFVVLLRVFGFIWPQYEFWPGLVLGLRVPTVLFWILATITMTVGNVLALLQDNLRRLLAYSSVSHAGYMLIGLAAAPGLSLASSPMAGGSEAVLFYLVAYAAMTLGAFAVIIYLGTQERPVETVDDLAGLGQSHPGIALMMMLFLFSLLGMPLTAGFAGKLLIFMGAMALPAEAGGQALPDVDKLREYALMLRWLALIGAINAAIGGWYYLRIIGAMYLRSPLKALTPTRTWQGLAAMWICAAVTLGLGIYPWPLVKAAHKTAAFPEKLSDQAKAP